MDKGFHRQRGKTILLVLATLLALAAWNARPRADSDDTHISFLPVKEWGFGTEQVVLYSYCDKYKTMRTTETLYMTRLGPIRLFRTHLTITSP